MSTVLIDAFRPPFMQRALVEMLILSLLAGVVGVFVLLRRLAFVADALTHTVFPGVAIAFAWQQSLFVGALLSAILSAIALTLVTSGRRVDHDAALVAIIASFFAVGVIVVSRSRSYTADLTALLFGRILTVDRGEIFQTAIIGVVVLGGLLLFAKELIMRAFDPGGAEAQGYPVGVLDLMLNLAVALVVVAALQAGGTLLVITLIVTPAAIARLVSAQIPIMIAVACATSAVGGWLGLAFSYDASVHRGWRVAAGPAIAVGLTVMFLVVAVGKRAWILLSRRRSRRSGQGGQVGQFDNYTASEPTTVSA